ncbi:MAG: 30S ribosomal protein S2 [candidate division WOR-3 bacterium]|nr:30S ribosomal protein S2 [candidate division WOR-3 bacterium]MCX7757699.1 30S ribosomal protein S2 [candidate division WOR-3 bacterium]MDW7987435.1 30S ribosomal protein S2 [candidate division WOR-3 bacterium]
MNGQLITIKDLLEAGVHFGHRARRWNPKMKPYIFGRKNDIFIIDLEKTLEHLKKACDVVRRTVELGHDVLFVGTKPQAQPIIEEEAKRCGAFYVNERWVGGLFTNFEVVSKRIHRMIELERLLGAERLEGYTKKERLNLEREYKKLYKIFNGVREMDRLPGIVYVVDVVREATPIAEARRMKIPIVAMIDTNGDPEKVDYPIPSNDDALRSIKLITKLIADSVLEGKKGFEDLEAQSAAEEESEV